MTSAAEVGSDTQNVLIKALPIHNFWEKNRIKRYYNCVGQNFFTDEAIEKTEKKFSWTDEPIKSFLSSSFFLSSFFWSSSFLKLKMDRHNCPIQKLELKTKKQERSMKESELKMDQQNRLIQKSELDVDWYNRKIESVSEDRSIRPITHLWLAGYSSRSYSYLCNSMKNWLPLIGTLRSTEIRCRIPRFFSSSSAHCQIIWNLKWLRWWKV